MNNEKKAPVQQIKFRGLRVDGKGWVYGDLKRSSDNRRGGTWWYIWVDSDDIEEDGEYVQILPHTVGQLHNGLTKKAGQDVYVGDKISHDLAEGLGEPLTLRLKSIVDTVEMHYYFHTNIKVIGNIHEESEVSNG